MSKINAILDFDGNWEEFWDQMKACVTGEQPNDLEQMCLKLGQKYMAEHWRSLSIENIEVKRLTSGLSNQTYYCKIRESVTAENNQMIVRLYGITNRMNFETLELKTEMKIDEGIVALMASEKGIGPKVYGLFEKGQIMKHYQVYYHHI